MPEPYRRRKWWLPLLVVSALPGCLVAIIVALLVSAAESPLSAWSELGFYLQVALIPFYVAGVTVAVHRHLLRADADDTGDGATGTRRRLSIVAPVLSLVVVATMFVLYITIADSIGEVSRHVDGVDASCSNSVRQIVVGTTTTQEVAIYDRYCPLAPNSHTVNVSILAPRSEIDGPGNVFVAEELPSPPGGPQGVSTFASPEGPHRVHVTYAPQTHVLVQRERFGDIAIEFTADTLSR